MIKDKIYTFGTALKVLPTEGNLVYEYNPFYNYRLDRTMIYYKKRLWDLAEFAKELGIIYDEETNQFKDKSENVITSWNEIIPKSETPPIVYQKGQLVDFETDQLNFNIHNPVNITPQWSYDNSVNLIINDGLNPPRLINSRFSATEKNKYQVCNRKGNNDSNIYDQGVQFDIDTSLYKKMNTIPKLRFLGVSYGGNLSIGNYHFYFRYVDEDGNESDYFAESGLVSIFIGNSADSINSGFRDQNAYKQVKFLLQNTDAGYTKVAIYYTKATSDIYQNATVQAKKIQQEYKLNDNGNTIINISGFEDVVEVSVDEINVFYQMYGSVETQDQCQNMLFLANVDKPKIPYEDLADCALRFLPILDYSEIYPIDQIGKNYTGSIANTYYDPDFIYNKVGYWDDEIYRFGIVFIQSDNTLTEVFNVRGGKIDKNTKPTSYTQLSLFEDDKKEIRQYLSYDEQYYNIVKDSNSTIELENAKGTIHINCPDFEKIIGFNFYVDKEVLDYLKDTLHIKGYFFVRQKRMPTTLCQAYTIGIDKQSHTPVLPTAEDVFITESFLVQPEHEDKEQKILSHNYNNREYTLEKQQVSLQGAICPEYDVNSSYLNTLFAASELVCRNCDTTNYLTKEDNNTHFYPNNFIFNKSTGYTNIKVIGVEDNVKLVAINDNMFSARAGEAEEAFRFEYIGKKNVNQDATNLIRGSYGPYLGITGYEEVGKLIDIKIPGYTPALLNEYFSIRYNDKSPFYAITERFSFEREDEWNIDYNIKEKEGEPIYYKRLQKPVYRGDCYICQFTHRINRNFQDPSAPTNDEIVDPKCWKDNFKVTDGVMVKENFEKINLGDVNAIQLGMYVTLVIRSTMNLNIRALDHSMVDEEAMFGHPRGFYPYFPITTKGSYKIPEALCYNKGFEASLSSRYNFEVPNVPWIKNEFSNRIAYSNIQVQDAFQNGWRTFIGTHYRDYPKTYGSITKLIELGGNLICVFEHGVALIPVNERALAGEGSGGNVYVNTSNVLPENPKILSDTFGSQWRESIIKTPQGIYGVDTVGKKIWRTNGQNFECISDFKIQEFLNNNISLTERELEPIIGIRNVKAHYNKFKYDVMFTFYDNLYGFEEKVWNLCWNEAKEKWITFYSWVPSYSENIHNQYFSFDRNTSKWIAKLGISKKDNNFSDGICLSSNVIPNDAQIGYKIGELSLENRTLPSGTGITTEVTYELVRDTFKNYEKFRIDFEIDNNIKHWYLYLNTDINNLCSELYERDDNGAIKKDDSGRRIYLSREQQKNPDKIVTLLNIKANIKVTYNGINPTLAEAYTTGFINGTKVDAGYYQSTIAIIPNYNMQFLTTDFWKHGQAGIIDIADKIYPTYWYGKQHPFEFEFVVADNPQSHKIFDDLEIISNYAEPESFHYEIVGDCYEFAKDKKNMYIRQEATKEFYQYNGSDILFNSDYVKLDSEHRQRYNIQSGQKIMLSGYDKSTLFPLYYNRKDSFNEIEDYYYLKDGSSQFKNFSQLAGAEIVKYNTEYRIWNHAKAVNIQDSGGRMRGNMHYKEDKWDIQINPINLVQKNEPEWDQNDLIGGRTLDVNKIPIEIGQNPIPDVVLQKENLTYPDDFPKESKDRAVVRWNWKESQNREVKPKDKWIKIRIRYKGDKLAVITAIKTLYSISYA